MNTTASNVELSTEPFPRTDDPWYRYVKDMTPATMMVWRFDRQPRTLPAGRRLRIEVMAPAVVHYSADDWRTSTQLKTCDTGMGFYYVDLPTDNLKPASRIRFTFHWPQANRWEEQNFQIPVEDPSSRAMEN